MKLDRILLSGFTAAGKTTHAQLLARELGWAYIGMSEIMSSVIPPSLRGSREWETSHDEYRASHATVDQKVDQLMSDRVRATSNLVVDAWLQPWLYTAPALRVWIDSDRRSRAMKCVVSFLREGKSPPEDPVELIDRKDQFSVKQFQANYGVAFGPDNRVFDLTVDNSRYISAPTIMASDVGIRSFHLVLLQQVLQRL